MKRRSFLLGLRGVVPSVFVAGNTGLASGEREKMIEIITDLESAPGYMMAREAWARAHIAGQLRLALGMDVPPNKEREYYLHYDQEDREISARRAILWAKNTANQEADQD